MINEQTPKSLSSLIKSELTRIFAWAILFLVVTFGVYGTYSVLHTRHEIEKFVIDHSVKLSTSASNTEGLLFIGKEIHSFSETLKTSFPYDIKIGITSNGQLISQEGDTHGLSVFESRIKKNVMTSSQDDLEISVEMNYQKMVLTLLYSMLGLAVFVSLFFRFLELRLNRSVTRLTAPLAEVARTVERISKNLPVSAKEPVPFSRSSVQEVNILGRSIELLLSEITQLDGRLTDAQLDRTRLEFAEIIGHNIRSPLSTLQMSLERLPDSSPEKNNIRQSISRIRDLADRLGQKDQTIMAMGVPKFITKWPEESKNISIEFLPLLISPFITEKRIQYRDKLGIDIDFVLSQESCSAFAKVDSTHLNSMISNLIDNSVESIPEFGSVTVGLKTNGDDVVISIQDTGCGIVPEILPKLTQKGATFLKENGNGLGLYHAKQSVQKWGGSLNIESQVGIGTTVRLILPRATAPLNFVSDLKIDRNSVVVCLDDDGTIPLMWKSKISAEGGLRHGIKFLSFGDATSFIEWHKSHALVEGVKNTLYLIDYNLGPSSMTGLDVIEHLKISQNSILVTSQFSDPKVLSRSQQMGCRYLPKTMTPFIPIVWNTEPKFKTLTLDTSVRTSLNTERLT